MKTILYQVFGFNSMQINFCLYISTTENVLNIMFWNVCEILTRVMKEIYFHKFSESLKCPVLYVCPHFS